MSIFISRSGQTFGPYDWPGIHAMLLAGQLSPGDLAWMPGESGWVALSQLALSHPPTPQQAPTTPLPPQAPPPPGAPPLPPVPPPAPPPPPPAPFPGSGTQPPFPGGGTQPPFPALPGGFPGGAGGSAFPSDPGEEQVIFDTSASPLALSMSDLVIGAFTCGVWLIYVVALNLTTRYRLTNQRLTLRSGIISQKVEEIEVYRVRDVTVEQETMGRLLGFGDVIVHASDASSPRLVLKNVPSPMRVKEQVRTAARLGRKSEGVRATEFMP